MTDVRTSNPRSLAQALANAERLRGELPRLIQPSNTDYDMVVLADEIARLRADAEHVERYWQQFEHYPKGSPDEKEARPYCWVMPGDDTADMNGWIDARVAREGEFTKPLYVRPALETSERRLIDALASWVMRNGGGGDPWACELMAEADALRGHTAAENAKRTKT